MESVVFWTLFIFTGSIVADDGPQLQIIPTGAQFERPLGHNFMFTCEIAGLGPQIVNTNLQWFNQQGTEITETAGGDRLVYVEKDALSPTKKLYFTQIQQQHAGTYTCAGVVEGNRQQQSVTLLLYQPITFDNAPSPQYPIIHTTALIACRVSGQPNPTVSWRYRGIKLQTGGRFAQDQYGLHITDITPADNGIYTCRAEVDREGTYDEVDIMVTVYSPPRIALGLATYTGVQSQQFVITCTAVGLPPPKYMFTKGDNTNPLYTTDRTQIDPDSGDISFRPLHKEDEGVYNCRAYNDAGEDHGYISLFVQVPPTIYDLKNVTASETNSVALVCNSYGDPAPDMAFQKAWAPAPYVMGSNEGGRIVQTNVSKGSLELRFYNLMPDDMSNYTCRSRNVAGYHERNGTVSVQFVPLFAPHQITRLYIWAGKSRNMTCHVRAEPMPVIEWRRYDDPRFGPIMDNMTFHTYKMGLNSNLQISVREIDQSWIYGNFTCRARNQLGQRDFKILLIRGLLPAPPKSVTILEVLPNLVRLDIELPLDNGGVEVFGYMVVFDIGKILEFLLGDDYLIEALRPSTTYIMQVRARNEVGLGAPLSISVTTKDVSVPDPLILTSDAYSRSSYEYIVTWAKPNTGGLPIREYEFKFREIAHSTHHETSALSEWLMRRHEDDPYHPMTYFALENLRANTKYQLEVRARNDIGWSNPSDDFVFTTATPGGGTGPDPERPLVDNAGSQYATSFLLLIFVLCCHLLTATGFSRWRTV